jgi:hypothetical protein
MRALATPRLVWHLLAGLTVLLMLVWLPPAPTAWAQQGPRTIVRPDSVALFRVTADVVAPRDGPAEVRFDTIVDYQLISAEKGFLLLFIFEDGAEAATMNTDESYHVELGPGRARLQTSYQPKPEVQNLVLTAGLFMDDGSNTFVAWASVPISLESVPGRVAFARAMGARNDGDFSGAVKYLTTAITAAPDNGYFYYWRADSQMRLNQFDAAIADFGKAIDRLPDDRASHLGRGVAWLWKDSWQEAIADVTSVIEAPGRADQMTAWAYRARGVARAGLGQADPAMSDYRAYLSLWPQAPDRGTIEGWIEELSLSVASGGAAQNAAH